MWDQPGSSFASSRRANRLRTSDPGQPFLSGLGNSLSTASCNSFLSCRISLSGKSSLIGPCHYCIENVTLAGFSVLICTSLAQAAQELFINCVATFPEFLRDVLHLVILEEELDDSGLVCFVLQFQPGQELFDSLTTLDIAHKIVGIRKELKYF